jgi:hypothetical protein
MTTLRKAMPFTLLCAALLVCLPLAAQNNPDCSFTYRFTGDGTQTAVSNLSGNTPCVNWRVTLSTDAAIGGTLSSTVTFQTSPDNATWTPVPNTICSATVQPPCVLQGANPITGTQGMLYAAAYGAYVQVVISASSGTGNGIVRGYGSKGASASALPPGGGGGGGSGTVTQVNTTGPITGGPITGSGTIALDTTKVTQKFFGTAAPGSVAGNLPGDSFTDTANHKEYVCNAPAATATPACTSVTAAGWILTNGAGSFDCADATGSTTVYTCPTPSPVPTVYSTGALVSFKPQTTNTTTGPTLNVAGLGAKNMVANTGGAASLTVGQLIGGSTYLFEYDGTVLRLTGGGGTPGSGTVTNTGPMTANAVILGNGGVDVKPGAVLPADATKFYDGTGNFSAPPAASAVPAASNLTPVTVSANTTADQTLQEIALTAGALNTVKAANLIHGSGRFTIAALQTPTLTFKAKLCTVSGCGSGTVVTLATITSGATLASTDQGWNLQLMAGTSASGTTGNLWVHGAPGLTVDIGALPGSAATPYTDTNTAVSGNIDLTAALFVDFTVATSSGNAGNSITQDIAEVLPQGAGGGGGGGSLTFGSLAARPGTGTAGQQYIATDTLIDSYIWDTAWRAFFSGQIVNPPAIADLAVALTGGSATRTIWADQGGAGGGIMVEATNSSAGSDSGIGQFKLLPATPWTLTSRFRINAAPVPGGDNLWAGIALYDANSSQLEIIGVYQRNVRVGYFTNINGYNRNVYSDNNIFDAVGRGASFLFRVSQDGTNRIISRSLDGLNWIVLNSSSQTDFLTPTHYGILVFAYNGRVQLSVIDLTMQ